MSWTRPRFSFYIDKEKKKAKGKINDKKKMRGKGICKFIPPFQETIYPQNCISLIGTRDISSLVASEKLKDTGTCAERSCSCRVFHSILPSPLPEALLIHQNENFLCFSRISVFLLLHFHLTLESIHKQTFIGQEICLFLQRERERRGDLMEDLGLMQNTFSVHSCSSFIQWIFIAVYSEMHLPTPGEQMLTQTLSSHPPHTHLHTHKHTHRHLHTHTLTYSHIHTLTYTLRLHTRPHSPTLSLMLLNNMFMCKQKIVDNSTFIPPFFEILV